jgi:hypothetical protein
MLVAYSCSKVRWPVLTLRQGRNGTAAVTVEFILQSPHNNHLVRMHYGSFTLANFAKQNCQRQRHVTVITVLALATLGNGQEIETILSVLHHPRWPRRVRSECHRRYKAKFRQWKHGLNDTQRTMRPYGLMGCADQLDH